jgi:hypothetical protein
MTQCWIDNIISDGFYNNQKTVTGVSNTIYENCAKYQVITYNTKIYTFDIP